MTYEQVIDRLVEIEVTKWGEDVRAASRRILRKRYPLIGGAMNHLAHIDVDNIDQALAAEASRLMTKAEHKALRSAARGQM